MAKHIHMDLHINIGPSSTLVLQPKSAPKRINEHTMYSDCRRVFFYGFDQFFNFLDFLFLQFFPSRSTP